MTDSHFLKCILLADPEDEYIYNIIIELAIVTAENVHMAREPAFTNNDTCIYIHQPLVVCYLEPIAIHL